jgi:hypothetical protein
MMEESSSMNDRRYEKRATIEASGAFLLDGVVSMVKIRDKNTNGVGVYSYRQFKPGQQGLLLAKWDDPAAADVDEVPAEVCWCMPDPMADDKDFPFRIGLRILTAAN